MGYAESSGDIPDDVRYKMANWRLFCLTFSTFLLITSNQIDSDIASYSKKGYAETSGDIGNDVGFKMADWQQSSIEMDDFHSLH